MRFAHLRRSVRRPLGGQSIGRDRWLLLALPLLLLALPVETAQATSRAAESAETEEAPPNPAQPAVRRPAPRPAAPRPAPAAVLRPPQPAPQPVVNVPPCFPRLLLPPSGRDAKPEILGTMDPVARANYMQAIHLLHCETGRDVEALALLKDGAKVGFRPSIRALGSRIIDDPAVLGEEAAAYLKIFTKEANAGSASAANLVGVMMDGGIGTKADPVGAGKFYRAAAADGSQRALEWLAYASATGRGTRADRAGAQRFHARLERDRGVRAARDIVVALELGREGKRDEAGARFWADALRSLDKDGEAKVAVELEKAWQNGTDTKADLDILAVAKRYNGIEARYQIALRQLAGAGEAQRAVALADLRLAALAGHAGAAQTLAAMMVASGADGTIATPGQRHPSPRRQHRQSGSDAGLREPDLLRRHRHAEAVAGGAIHAAGRRGGPSRGSAPARAPLDGRPRRRAGSRPRDQLAHEGAGCGLSLVETGPRSPRPCRRPLTSDHHRGCTMPIIPVILSGGAGTRLWPASRDARPKQFLDLFGPLSTFQETLKRVADPALFERPIILTNRDHRFLVAEQTKEIGIAADIVLEPVRRDSGPAIAAGAHLAIQRAGPDAIVVVLAADHVIRDPAAFAAACANAAEAAARGLIVTFGMTPDRPETSYGYVKPGALLNGCALRALDAFVEKPDRSTAERYLADGYLWNSGNFLFGAATLLREYADVDPQTVEAAGAAVANAVRDLDFIVLDEASFRRTTPQSIDYAVMERTKRAAVLPGDFGWSDVGSWDAVWAPVAARRERQCRRRSGADAGFQGQHRHVREARRPP